jgi:hypothetical protein
VLVSALASQVLETRPGSSAKAGAADYELEVVLLADAIEGKSDDLHVHANSLYFLVIAVGARLVSLLLGDAARLPRIAHLPSCICMPHHYSRSWQMEHQQKA